ncbi:MAG: MarC family protein [Planctomycetaceae bacterium]|nr:MarC family protein [Planctomycetaceae bacterium]
MDFDLHPTRILSATVVLFALIDVLGSVPLFLMFKKGDRVIHPFQASVFSFIFLVAFLFVGRIILSLFNVDVSSFAVAGSLVVFIISIEMVFGVEIFKFDAPGNSITLVPVVFPLIAGPGTFTALLSMRSEFGFGDLIMAIFLNMIVVWLVLRHLDFVQKLLGISGVYVMRKFFGIILMAIAVRLFTANLPTLLGHVPG